MTSSESSGQVDNEQRGSAMAHVLVADEGWGEWVLSELLCPTV